MQLRLTEGERTTVSLVTAIEGLREAVSELTSIVRTLHPGERYEMDLLFGHLLTALDAVDGATTNLRQKWLLDETDAASS